MPGIVPFIPLIASVVGGAGAMVDQNVQNKAAIKNNENQQAASLANAKAANAQAQQTMNAFTANNPAPTGGVAPPPAGSNTGTLAPQSRAQAATPQTLTPAMQAAIMQRQAAPSAPAQVAQAPQPLSAQQLMQRLGISG
jgi:hypothetical protein